MRRERPRPAVHAGVVEHRLELRPQQARIEQECERRARIDHVDRGNTAVAEVLLGEVHGSAIDIGHQLVSRQGLAVGQHGQPRVILASQFAQVGGQLLIEPAAAFEQPIVVAPRFANQVGCFGALAPPPGTLAALEILDRVEVVVRQHQEPLRGIGAHLAQVDDVAERRVGPLREIVGIGKTARSFECFPGLAAIHGGLGNAFGLVGGDVEVAPVDAHIVAAPGEHGLLARSHAKDGMAVEAVALRHHGLVGRIHDQVGGGFEIDRHGVLAAVGGGGRPIEVGQRPREDFEVVRQGRGEERQPQLHARAFEFVDRARRLHFQARLIERRQISRVAPHDPECLAVDACQSGERVRLAGPVAGTFGVQAVGHRPDAEIRIVRHQRNGRRPHGRRCLPRRGERQNREEESGRRRNCT